MKFDKKLLKEKIRHRNEIIWNNVTRIAEEKGLNKTQLAEIAEIDNQRITKFQNLEGSGSGVGPNVFAKFCLALQVEPEDLLTPKNEEVMPSNDELITFLKRQVEKQDQRIDKQLEHIDRLLQMYESRDSSLKKAEARLEELQLRLEKLGERRTA